MKRTLATLALAAATLTPAPATAAPALDCINITVSDGGHTVSIKCVEGPGTRYQAEVQMMDAATGQRYTVRSAWRDFGTRAQAHSNTLYYLASYGVNINVRW